MISINSSKLILESERFKVESIEYELDGVQLYKKDIIRHPGAVVILPMTADGNLIFIRQPRIAVGLNFLELPAGTMKNEESALDCAKRELAEEVGLAADDWQSLGVLYPAPGFCDEKLFLFVAKGLSEHKLPHDAEERISIHYYSYHQVKELIINQTLEDAKSLAFLFRAQISGIL